MRLLKIGSAFILCLLWAAVSCHARQESGENLENEDPEVLRQERVRRLSINGLLVSKDIKLHPVLPTDGEILQWPAIIRASRPVGQIKAMRLHFIVRRLDEPQRGTWGVTVTAGNRTWKFDSRDEPESADFWTPQMPEQLLTVRVFSTVPRSTLQLEIDQVIEYEEPVRQKTIVGLKDDTVPMRDVSSPTYREWARSVALLTFKGRTDGKLYTCTGFLVSPRHLITNDHCPRSKSEITSAIVEFDYDDDFAATDRYKLTLDQLPRDKFLDFAVYRLDRDATSRSYLRLRDDDGNLTDLRPLIIIQHPGGRPKRLASYKCNLTRPRSPVAPRTDFGHLCDTEGGSSGSPVQNTRGEVIGLHHFGYGDDDSQKINQAVKVGEILRFIGNSDLGQDLYRLLTRP
ncbi:MAG: serine protease [Pyrinomonadaceae bacterium]